MAFIRGIIVFAGCKGLVISIGVPLRHCMTLLHVGEDMHNEQWPIKDFFEERPYIYSHQWQR